MAAYLSICIRLSPTIFYFSNVLPNTRYEEEEHHSVDEECYLRSKGAVVEAYNVELRAYDDKKKRLQNRMARLTAACRGDTSRAIMNARQKLNAHIRTEPYGPEHRYEPMAKIGVWPNINRFKPGTPEDDDVDTPLDDRRGFRIFEISKSAMVCYFGTEDTEKKAQQRVTVEDFVTKKVKKYGQRGNYIGKGLVLAAVVAAAATAGIPYLLYGWTLGAW